MITGLITLELYKVLEKKPIESFRNAYVNLAIPIFAFSEPVAPDRTPNDKENRYEPNGCTAWDTIVVNGDLTLREIFDYLNQKFNMEVTNVSIGLQFLYSQFMDHQERLDLTLTQNYHKFFGEIEKTLFFIDLVVVGEDKDDDMITVNLAPVRVFFREEKEKK